MSSRMGPVAAATLTSSGSRPASSLSSGETSSIPWNSLCPDGRHRPDMSLQPAVGAQGQLSERRRPGLPKQILAPARGTAASRRIQERANGEIAGGEIRTRRTAEERRRPRAKIAKVLLQKERTGALQERDADT